jgi:5-methylcytosine-specific restriction endonuclease McrA
MAVFVIDKRKDPLMPCSEKRARLLLEKGKAVIHRRIPFTIRLKDRIAGEVQPLCVKVDPGSKTTGLAVTTEYGKVVFAAEIQHRGQQAREALQGRKGFRKGRRSRNLRYRAPRFDNRTRLKGWLPPSLESRIGNIVTWAERLRKLAPVTSLSQELVRFDLQQMENPEISGIEYQQGTLAGYEVREYLLEKWGRKCAYCDEENTPLQIDHIHAKASGGSNRISNLTLACGPCNQKKDSLDIEVFLKSKPKILKRILAQAKRPLKDAAAVNATRWELYNRLTATGLPVEIGSGGRTKFNRTQQHLPKSHWIDAACVGLSGEQVVMPAGVCVFGIKAMGRGSYQRTRVNASGFPRGYLSRQKQYLGFQTGDIVIADVPKGKKSGVHAGRVAIRMSGSFNIQTADGVVQGISHRHCRVIQRGDGYNYSTTLIANHKGERAKGHALHDALSLPGLNAGVSRAA